MMSFEKRKLLLGLASAALLSAPAFAQAQETAPATADEFGVEMDEMPPQPVQPTLPEPEVQVEMQDSGVKTEVNIGTMGTETTVDVTTKPTPDMTGVTVQPDSEILTPVPDETAASEEAAKPTPVPHSGQYYDSDYIVPSASLGGAAGPREVDPKYEPGSRFVVVRKGAGPDSIQAKMVAAQRALSLGRYASALELYDQLYKKQPKDKQVLMGLAVAQQHSGFTESAIATYEELLRLDPKNTDATVNMLGLIKSQYPSVAYRKLKDLWDNNTQNPGIAAQLGLISASLGNIEDAVRYLGVAASMEPTNAQHFYNMAVVSDQAGAYRDALELYEKALEVDITYGNGRSVPREQIYDRLAYLRRL